MAGDNRGKKRKTDSSKKVERYGAKSPFKMWAWIPQEGGRTKLYVKTSNKQNKVGGGKVRRYPIHDLLGMS